MAPEIVGRPAGRIVAQGLVLAGSEALHHRARAPARRRQIIESRLRRLALHHEVGDGVGMALVVIVCFADAALELNTAALLHHMRGLVGGGVQIGRSTECDVAAGGIRGGPDLCACDRGSPADMGAHAADVVAPKRGLNRLGEGQRAAAAADPLLGRGMDVLGRSAACAFSLHVWRDNPHRRHEISIGMPGAGSFVRR